MKTTTEDVEIVARCKLLFCLVVSVTSTLTYLLTYIMQV